MSSAEQLDEMGPIDYVVLEWPGRQPSGEVAPLILDLRGPRDHPASSTSPSWSRTRTARSPRIDLAEDSAAPSFAEFDGASTGLLGDEDLEEAADALEPGTSAAVLVWENRWAAPVAVALAGRAASSSPAGASPSRPSSPRSTRSRQQART